MRRRFVDFWVEAGFQPALGAGALCLDAAIRTGAPARTASGYALAGLGGTLALYGGRRILQSPGGVSAPSLAVSDKRILTTSALGSAALLIGASALPFAWMAYVLGWGVLGAAYSLPIFGKRLREFGPLKPAMLALAWTAITCPPPSDPTSAAIFATRLPALFALCLLFDRKDRIRDAEAGVKTPAVLLTSTSLHLVAALFLLESLCLIGALAPPVDRNALWAATLVAASLPPYRSMSQRQWILRGDGALIALGALPFLLR